MDEAELRAAVKDAFIDVEMGRCDIMEGVERIMAVAKVWHQTQPHDLCVPIAALKCNVCGAVGESYVMGGEGD
jgi:hypothetical protein